MSAIQIWNGEPIDKPGIYAGVPIDVYHSAIICGDEPSVSSSVLRKLFMRSAGHYWAYSPYNPNAKPPEDVDTEALILGRAAHHVLLGEQFFAERYVIRPDKLRGEDGLKPWNGNRNVCRNWLENHRHLIVLSPGQAEQITGMASALAEYPLVAEGGLNGHVECSMFWKDKRTGLWLKARPDVMPVDSGAIVDLKKTRSVDYFALQAALDDYGYYMQAAMIFEGAKQLKWPAESFTLLFFENNYPHLVRDVTLKDEDIALGAEVNAAMLDKFARCWKSGEWHGYADGNIGGTIELSERSRERIKRRLGFEKTSAELSRVCADSILAPSLDQRGDGFPGVDAITATIESARSKGD